MASNSSSAPSSSSTPTASAAMGNVSANNPYFLPANENPSLILTSQPLIGPENYMTWARSMFLALSSRNKFGFVNGSISELDPTSPLFNSWNRCNTTILSWLTNSLNPDLKASVMYINSTKDLWIDLKNRLSQDNTPRLFELQKEISYLVQGSLSMSSYFTKFKTLWDKFMNNQPFTVCTCACVCGSQSSQLDAQHKEHVFRFLMGLNDSYGNLIGQVLLIELFPSLSKVCSLVLQEEKWRNIGNIVNVVQQLDAMAMYVNNNRPFQGNQGPNKGGGKGKKDRPVCTSNSTSSSSNFSSNPFWIPPNFSHSVFSAQVVDRTAFKSDSWIIDTGATDHMVHSVT